jgi:hypothetical protein
MLKDLVKLASRLDEIGLTKEADYLDQIIRKIAEGEMIREHTVSAGEVFSKIVEGFGDTNHSLQDQISLNKKRNPSFDPDSLKVGQVVFLYVPPEFESN